MELAIKINKVRDLLTELDSTGNCLEDIVLAYHRTVDRMTENNKCIKDIDSLNLEISNLLDNGETIINRYCNFLTMGLEKYTKIENDIAYSASELPEFSNRYKNNAVNLASNQKVNEDSPLEIKFCVLDFNINGRRLKIIW